MYNWTLLFRLCTIYYTTSSRKIPETTLTSKTFMVHIIIPSIIHNSIMHQKLSLSSYCSYTRNTTCRYDMACRCDMVCGRNTTWMKSKKFQFIPNCLDLRSNSCKVWRKVVHGTRLSNQSYTTCTTYIVQNPTNALKL